MSAEDRRQFIRIPSRLNAQFTVVGSDPSRDILARNVSGSGIGFFTDPRLPHGAVLRVQLKFPTRKHPLIFTGEVVWSGKLLLERAGDEPRGYEVGIRFIDIDPDDQAFIIDYSTTYRSSASDDA